MKLIVGLGNPGQKYEKTRHNIGFAMLEKRAERSGATSRKFDSKYKADLANLEIGGEKVLLCKPQTYMNLSGEAISPLVRFFKLLPGDVLVLHDEIDFSVGRVALKLGGSAAGHNGLKSIIEKIGSREFWRVRIGVDRPAVQSQVSDWVLGGFRPEERTVLQEKEQEIFELIEKFLKEND